MKTCLYLLQIKFIIIIMISDVATVRLEKKNLRKEVPGARR